MSVWRNSRNITHGPPKNVENEKCLRVVLRFVSALRHLWCFFARKKKNRKLHLMGSEASQWPTMSQFHNFSRPNSRVHPRHDGTLCYNETSGHKAAPVSWRFFFWSRFDVFFVFQTVLVWYRINKKCWCFDFIFLKLQLMMDGWWITLPPVCFSALFVACALSRHDFTTCVFVFRNLGLCTAPRPFSCNQPKPKRTGFSKFLIGHFP